MGSSLPSSEEGFGQASRRFWEERYGRPLSDEELREIRQNMMEFAKLLLEWGEEAEASSCQHREDSVAPEDSADPAGEEGTDTP